MGLILHGSYVNGFSKNNSCIEQMGHLGPIIAHPASQLWIHFKDCFTVLHNERGQDGCGNYVNGFSERNLIQSNLVISAQKWYGILKTLDLLSGFFY